MSTNIEVKARQVVKAIAKDLVKFQKDEYGQMIINEYDVIEKHIRKLLVELGYKP